MLPERCCHQGGSKERLIDFPKITQQIGSKDMARSSGCGKGGHSISLIGLELSLGLKVELLPSRAHSLGLAGTCLLDVGVWEVTLV